MNIKVYNDGKLVHDGTVKSFLEINEYDNEVQDQINEAIENGQSERLFFSGKWVIKVNK